MRSSCSPSLRYVGVHGSCHEIPNLPPGPTPDPGFLEAISKREMTAEAAPASVNETQRFLRLLPMTRAILSVLQPNRVSSLKSFT